MGWGEAHRPRTYRDGDGSTRRLLPSRSRKRAGEDRRYRAWRDEVLARRPRCEVCPRIRDRFPDWTGCGGRAVELHHRRRQSQDRSLRMVEANVLPTCRMGNTWCEVYDGAARDLGLVLSAGDPL